MPDILPTNKSAWRQAAKLKKIDHSQSLTAGTPLVSGSKFEFIHFLRLRVLYIERQPPEDLAETSGFPTESLKEIEKILDENTDANFLKTFLQDRININSHWNVENAQKCGIFAVALEHLHLIAKRGLDFMTDNEDMSDLKIISSPPKGPPETRRMAHSGAHYHESSLSTVDPPTPTPKSRQSHWEPASLGDISDILDMSGLTIESPREAISAPNSDLRRAMDMHERANFSPGDEQTVNAALVALIMALSWLLGRTGRVHHDRVKFTIPKDADTHFYSACVDGVIMHLNRDKWNGFMEVKRDFRSKNASVRRQIAAQMAAFIFVQDVELARKETEEDAEKRIEKTLKGKGKSAQAKAKAAKIKDKDGGNQEQLRKWMVSLDGYYAYINIATYNRKYVEFLSDSHHSNVDDAFMEMVEYGTFDLRVWSGDGLEMFLTHIGALMLGTVGP